MLGGGRFLFCAALVVGALSACADSAIRWGRAIDLGPGLYGRVHRLADGRFMAAYEKDGGIVARFATRDNLRDWGDEKVVAKGFVATNGAASVRVGLSNPEFAQLASGRIIYACNLRPHEWRHDIHPCGIALSTSDDGGQTWSALRTVYAPVPAMPVDGHPHGCYEPFVLPLRGGKAQIYFADETPYADEKCAWQNISFIETSDNGQTWGRAKIAAFTPERRDGMPVVLDEGLWRYLAIETNPGQTKLHPQIVRMRVAASCQQTVLAPSPDRFDPFAQPRNWQNVYGGAPYLIATQKYLLLSWQEHAEEDSEEKTIARVAFVPKKEIRNGRFTTMRGISSPPLSTEAGDGMRWNSLCAVENDVFLLVTQNNGRIVLYPGRIERTK